MIFFIITFLILIPYIILILFYRKNWLNIRNYDRDKDFSENELPYISIIIAARNEEKNIGSCIQSIITQSYPKNKFEIIVTDDYSTDNTVPIIRSFDRENIRVLRLADFKETRTLNSYKKKSIETALQFASGELIVTTDADCIAPEKWLETLASFYSEESPAFVALPVSFFPVITGKGIAARFFDIFQSLDFMSLQGITGASVFKKFHSMCNGANLAYQKTGFYEVNGFEGIDQIASGDDMLLMHKFRKRYPDKVMFLKTQEVIVQTKSAKTIGEFMNQRIRWASKADKYTDKKITVVLFLVYLVNAWIFILGISSFFIHEVFYLFLISLGVKILVELVFLYPVSKFFKRQKLLWWFVPAQPFHILYTLIAGWLGKFGSYKWKGRKVK